MGQKIKNPKKFFGSIFDKFLILVKCDIILVKERHACLRSKNSYQIRNQHVQKPRAPFPHFAMIADFADFLSKKFADCVNWNSAESDINFSIGGIKKILKPR